MLVTPGAQATCEASATKVMAVFLLSAMPFAVDWPATMPPMALMFLVSALVVVSLPTTWPTELEASDGWVSVLPVPSTASCTPRLSSGFPAASRSVTVMATSSLPSATAFGCEMSMVDLSASTAAPVTQVPPALQTPPVKQSESAVH